MVVSTNHAIFDVEGEKCETGKLRHRDSEPAAVDHVIDRPPRNTGLGNVTTSALHALHGGMLKSRRRSKFRCLTLGVAVLSVDLTVQYSLQVTLHSSYHSNLTRGLNHPLYPITQPQIPQSGSLCPPLSSTLCQTLPTRLVRLKRLACQSLPAQSPSPNFSRSTPPPFRRQTKTPLSDTSPTFRHHVNESKPTRQNASWRRRRPTADEANANARAEAAIASGAVKMSDEAIAKKAKTIAQIMGSGIESQMKWQ